AEAAKEPPSAPAPAEPQEPVEEDPGCQITEDDELNAIRKQGRDAFLQASEDGSLEQAAPQEPTEEEKKKAHKDAVRAKASNVLIAAAENGELERALTLVKKDSVVQGSEDGKRESNASAVGPPVEAKQETVEAPAEVQEQSSQAAETGKPETSEAAEELKPRADSATDIPQEPPTVMVRDLAEVQHAYLAAPDSQTGAEACSTGLDVDPPTVRCESVDRGHLTTPGNKCEQHPFQQAFQVNFSTLELGQLRLDQDVLRRGFRERKYSPLSSEPRADMITNPQEPLEPASSHVVSEMEEGTAQPEQPEPGEAAANAEEASALVGVLTSKARGSEQARRVDAALLGLQQLATAEPAAVLEAVRPVVQSACWRQRNLGWAAASPAKGVFELAASCASHEAPGVRRDAVGALRRMVLDDVSPQRVCDLVLSLLEDSSSEVRLAAVQTMTALEMEPGDEEAAQVNRGMWINALSDPDVDVRIQAACAAERVLAVDSLEDPASESITLMADALGTAMTQTSSEGEKTPSPGKTSFQRRCVHSLGILSDLGNPVARHWLSQFHSHPDPQVRLVSVCATMSADAALRHVQTDANVVLRHHIHSLCGGEMPKLLGLPKKELSEHQEEELRWAIEKTAGTEGWRPHLARCEEDGQVSSVTALLFGSGIRDESVRQHVLKSLTAKELPGQAGGRGFPTEFCSTAEVQAADGLAELLSNRAKLRQAQTQDGRKSRWQDLAQRPMYELADFGDPWEYWSVHASQDRSKVSVVQNSRFGIGDVTFLMVIYGKLEYIQDTVKRLTKHTVHLTGGRKLEGVTVILKSLGLLGDWAVDRLHKMTQMATFGWCYQHRVTSSKPCAAEMAKLDGADCSWPSDEELRQVEEIRKICAATVSAFYGPSESWA
ncbi:unnamed protein product, partial [Symbiodinium necroappetens]